MSSSTSSGCIGCAAPVVREHEHQHRREACRPDRSPTARRSARARSRRIDLRASSPTAAATSPVLSPKLRTPKSTSSANSRGTRNGPSVSDLRAGEREERLRATQIADGRRREVEQQPARRPRRALHAERQHQAVERRRDGAGGRTDEQGGGGAERVGDREADRHRRHAQREPVRRCAVSASRTIKADDTGCVSHLPRRIGTNEQTGADDGVDQRRCATRLPAFCCVSSMGCATCRAGVCTPFPRVGASPRISLIGLYRYKLRGATSFDGTVVPGWCPTRNDARRTHRRRPGRRA